MSATILPIGSVLSTHRSATNGTNGTNGTGGTTSASSSGSTTSAASAVPANMTINQSQFLQLISTQMQNQDPLNPTDPTQFLAQIEGLSEVSSLQALQTSISSLTSSMQSAQMLSGTSLLGHSVLAPGSTAELSAGGSVSGAVSAPNGATNLTVSVTNASGALVDSFNVSPQGSGYTNFTWNGTTTSGAAAAAGQYSLSVNATVGAANQAVNPLLYSQVQSVTIDQSTQALDLNTVNGTIPLSSVVSVQQ
ncbi:MAG TPA: flagellar hook capping FlgD N-terminal domain-containing protein [Steroidobacteraceae bacterium]|jgi:flagellar basal-body rod modification protein FlgD|nr:flagellar hook capping FlgD N-terminal domain-containing protein [Steroidobacteraceae bacterium]